jgi:hypothetical protein
MELHRRSKERAMLRPDGMPTRNRPDRTADGQR